MEPVKDARLREQPLPTVTLDSTRPEEWKGDLLAITVCEEDVHQLAQSGTGPLTRLLGAFDGAVADAVTVGDFKGKKGQQSAVMRLGRSCAVRFLVLLGLGKGAELHAEWNACTYKAVGGLVAAAAKAVCARTVAVWILPEQPSLPASSTAASHVWHAILAGAISGLWEARNYKSVPTKAAWVHSVTLLHGIGAGDNAASQTAQLSADLALGECRGILGAKSLVEAPPNVCTPSCLAKLAAHVAECAPGVFSLKVLGKQEVAELGMGLYLGVAQGSDTPLSFIHLRYMPTGGASKIVALVGKGLTFDSGGYNLKTQGGIELMKIDMAGAAAVLGCAAALVDLQPPGVEVHFIIAACENMINGSAVRPSDILKSASGKFIEVNDTDAEGRLTLADALWYAQEKCGGVTSIVDIATLTGACGIALGNRMGGLFASTDAAAAAVMAAGQAAGERFWRLPLEEGDYRDMLDSASADMKNYGGRSAGATTAALFLKEFIKEGMEWAHLDVAGPVWDDKAGLPTGFGVSTLVHWVLAHATSHSPQ